MKEDKTLIFFIDDKAKITNAGKDMPFVVLKKGMRVFVNYRRPEDKRIAVRIKVLTKGTRGARGKPC